MAEKYGGNFKELLILMVKLIRENKFEDVAFSKDGVTYTSIRSFRNVNEAIEYVTSTNSYMMGFKRVGGRKYVEAVYISRLYGFRLNEKSVTIYYNPCGENVVSSGHSKNIRF